METKESIFEVEFKYPANNIALGDFLKTIIEHNRVHNIHIVTVSGRDFFFKNAQQGQFIRYRVEKDGAYAELTYKNKLSNNNSIERQEIDMPMTAIKHVPIPSLQHVQQFVGNLGFKLNASIYKTSFIIKLEKFVYAFYIVNQQDYYIEIEARKDVFIDKESALEAIEIEEKFSLAKLGLKSSDRIDRSLSEIYEGTFYK